MPSSIGSGLGSSVGFAKETTWGTPVTTPTRWITPESSKMVLAPQFGQGNGLRQGSMVHDQYERVWQAADAGGTITTSIFRSGLNFLYASLMGSLSVSPSGTAPSLTWTMPITTAYGSSFTMIEGIPQAGGVIEYWQSEGCKVSQGSFTAEVGSLPQATWTIDAQDRIEVGTTGTAATLPTSDQVYGWPQLAVKVGAVGSEAQLDGIKKVSWDIKKAFSDKRFNIGNLSSSAAKYGVKDEQIENGFWDIGGTLDTEYISTTSFVDNFMTQANFSIIIQFTGALISGSFYYMTTFAMPACRYTGGDPTIDGPDIIQPSLPFIALNDEVHVPVQITVQSSDSAL